MAGRIVLDMLNPALDSDGQIDDGCVLTFYANLTTDLQTIYSASDLLTPLANPLGCDAAGRFPDVWAEDGTVYTIKAEWTNGDIFTRNDAAAPFSNIVEVPVYIEGLPDDGETFPIYLPARKLRLPEDLVESRIQVKGALPTATAVFTLKKNGSAIGTISIATSGAVTASFNSAIDFTPDATGFGGDSFQLDAPSPDDATMSDISFTFAFQGR